jgi:hypothetical protein
LPALADLHADALHAEPIDVDWSEREYDYDGDGGEGTWIFWEMDDCFECEKRTNSQGYCETEECDRFSEHSESCEGPMMNYFYPLGGFASRELDPDWAAEQLYEYGATTCLVRLDGHQFGLALTGGGMDLSWEICQSYIALGLLPPIHFARLPEMAGRPRGDLDRHIVRACLKSFEVAASQDGRGKEHLSKMLMRGDRT